MNIKWSLVLMCLLMVVTFIDAGEQKKNKKYGKQKYTVNKAEGNRKNAREDKKYETESRKKREIKLEDNVPLEVNGTLVEAPSAASDGAASDYSKNKNEKYEKLKQNKKSRKLVEITKQSLDQEVGGKLEQKQEKKSKLNAEQKPESPKETEKIAESDKNEQKEIPEQIEQSNLKLNTKEDNIEQEPVLGKINEAKKESVVEPAEKSEINVQNEALDKVSVVDENKVKKENVNNQPESNVENKNSEAAKTSEVKKNAKNTKKEINESKSKKEKSKEQKYKKEKAKVKKDSDSSSSSEE